MSGNIICSGGRTSWLSSESEKKYIFWLDSHHSVMVEDLPEQATPPLECSEKTKSSNFENSTARFRTASQPWFQKQFLKSWLDHYPLAKLAKREVQTKKYTNKQTKIEIFNFHNQITNHVTVLISEQFLESWLDHFPLAKLAKREVHKMRKSPI